MIKITNCYKTSDDSIFKCLDDAQCHEIYTLLNLSTFTGGKNLVEVIMSRKKEIVNVLSLMPEDFSDDKVPPEEKKAKRVLITNAKTNRVNIKYGDSNQSS